MSAGLAERSAKRSMYGHLFGNPSTGLPRALYWSLAISLPDRRMFLVDWLRWPIRRWTELERCTLSDLVTPPTYEASIYEDGEHRPVSLVGLSFSQRQGAELGVCVNVDESGGRQQVATRVHMDGVIVQPSMIGPDHDVAAARVALGPYIDTSELGEGVFDRFRYVFSA